MGPFCYSRCNRAELLLASFAASTGNIFQDALRDLLSAQKEFFDSAAGKKRAIIDTVFPELPEEERQGMMDEDPNIRAR